MRNRSGTREYRVGTGASSLLMILVVLCLTTLGILSVSGAEADLKLSRRNAEMIAGYYRAEADCQQALAAIDAALKQTPVGKFSIEDVLDQSLVSCDISDSDEDGFTLSFDAGYGRALELRVVYAPADGGRYAVVGHELKNQESLADDSGGKLTLIA